jgi:hypothetical protein
MIKLNVAVNILCMEDRKKIDHLLNYLGIPDNSVEVMPLIGTNLSKVSIPLKETEEELARSVLTDLEILE